MGPDGFLQFGKMASPFTNRFNDQFLYNEAPTPIQDMGPSRAGTAINTLLQAVVGGRMTKASFATAQGMGLIDKDAKYKVGSAGTIQLEKRQFHGSKLAEQDPLQWVRQYLVPAMHSKYGAQHGDDTLLLLSQLFNNRNAQRPAMDFIQNDWRYIKDSAQTLKPRGIKSYDDMIKDDPNMAMAAAGAQWNKLWIQVGIGIVPKLVPLIEKLAAGLDRLTGIAQRHPDVAKAAVAIGLVTTAVLALGSAAALFMAVAGPGLGIAKGASWVGLTGATKTFVPAAIGYGIGHTFGSEWAEHDASGFGRFKSWMDSWLPNSMKAGAVPGSGSQPIVVNSPVTMPNGQVLARAVNDVNNKAMSGMVNNSPQTMDGRLPGPPQ